MPLAQGICLNPFALADSITCAYEPSWVIEMSGDTRVQIWQKVSFGTANSLNQLWMVKTAGPGNYILRNLRSGTVMDLADGSPKNHTSIIGFQYYGNSNQQWEIIEAAYVNLAGNYHVDGQPIIGYEYTDETDELWKFERRDASAVDIVRIAGSVAMDAHPTSANPMYYVPPIALLSEVWLGFSLSSDDKALEFRTAFIKWAEGNIRAAVDLSLLVGSAKALDHPDKAGVNWTLSDNYGGVVFFSPGTGSVTVSPGGSLFGLF
ncbi:hypothetical protein C8F04DRAFT_1341843 [Mycena alexandri]|uniref:Ricin B lectin domain-containing protein n=1 Tax=Mycena alexandri TaxID=1745969 RepID=A0AAD6RWP8_9AGAR|nr:hypothetical protein C8F04DRAFT_1341843 [Mycena alexandri]